MSQKKLMLNGSLKISDICKFTFFKDSFDEIEINEALKSKINFSFQALKKLIDQGTAIYGVTTGFGESCTRYVDKNHAEQLQRNLIDYLSCGQGEILPVEAARAMFLIRLNSLAKGISGVSLELIDRMCLLLKHDVIPMVPCEGSLGASGDLVPLAYLGQVVQGFGKVFYQGQKTDAETVLKKLNIPKYTLKPKEGLALVNGTSTMAGMALYNLQKAQYLVELVELATVWQCLLLGGRKEAFGAFINEVAKTNDGQKTSAANITKLLDKEQYHVSRGQDVIIENNRTTSFVQDPYSLRCVPQIMGPIRENLKHGWQILEHEINSVTDNPVVDDLGNLEMGGNFYGGYLCQSMDYLKINLAHIADLVDRQCLMIVTEKFNRGLPANLTNTAGIPANEHHLHHGLKGVHQTVSAITSEVIQKSIPSGIFSRSSESHNQDKVSLGMSAAMTCSQMLDGVYKIMAMHLVCLAQALDLKKIQLDGDESKAMYQLIRIHVRFLDHDRSLGQEIYSLTEKLKLTSFQKVNV